MYLRKSLTSLNINSYLCFLSLRVVGKTKESNEVVDTSGGEQRKNSCVLFFSCLIKQPN